ncbi:MAG: OmpA family protein [Gammaproteobacteria bacterium]|nr:OmpA family protein [Gammaproteobacteria bacterium]
MEETSRKTTRRYWRRSASPTSWWPWGFAPIAGLVVLFLFGALLMAPRIEAEVRKEVSERIGSTGVTATFVRTSGQGVVISAPAQPDVEPYLQAFAASTTCDTWAGQLSCPTTVAIRQVEPPSEPAVLSTRAEQQTLTMGGSTSTASAAVAVEEPVAKCNTNFDALLGNTSIRFRTGSASIDVGNDELLTRLAEVAQSCPGKLVVHGHTDDQGDASTNQALSVARANGVRDALISRGIDADRLSATGFGESQPIADNDTSMGRAKNRRIAIMIDEGEQR